MRTRRVNVVVAIAVAALFAAACRAPTQVTVHVTTDLDCVQVARNQVALYSGDPKAEAPVTSTSQCAPKPGSADIGTLVIVPSDAKDGVVDISVVVGVEGPSADCAAHDYSRCIRARRRVRFVPHEPLELPIEVSRACVDKVCDPTSTCFRGACVSFDVVPNGEGCVGPECDAAPAGTTGDASVIDNVVPSGPPVATLHVPRAALPRGITIAENELFWTEPFPGDATATAIVHADKATLGQSGITLPSMRWTAYGICSIGSDLYCAVTGANNTCAFATDANGKPPTAITCSGTSSLGAACLGSQVYLVGDEGVQEANDVSPTVPPGGFYAEPDGDRVVYATAFGLARWDRTIAINARAETVLDMKRAMRGIAVTPTHWLLSSATGEIYVISKSQPSTPAAPAFSGFTQLEDIAWDESTKTLFAAGRRDGQAGIYKITNLAFP